MMKGIAQAYLILAIIAFAGAAVVLAPSFIQPQSITGNGNLTIGSISLVDYLSNEAPLQGKAWLVQASAGGATGDKLVGFASQDAFKDASYKSGASAEFDAYRTYSNCIYTSTPMAGKDIYKIKLGWSNCPFNQGSNCNYYYAATDDAKQKCITQSDYAAFLGNDPLNPMSYQSYCFVYEKVGSAEDFTTKPINLDWNVRAYVWLNGSSTNFESVDLNPQRQTAFFPNNHGKVTWLGNLVANQFCSSPSNIIVVRGTGGDKIGQTALGLLSEVGNVGTPIAPNNQLKTCLSGTSYNFGIISAPMSYDSAWNCIQQYQNNQVDGLFAKPQSNIPAPYNGATFLGTSTATLKLPTRMIIPSLTFKLSADWLKTIAIVQLVGKAQWMSVTSPIAYASGSTGYLSGVLRNSGDVSASFNAWATCSNPAVAVLDSIKQNSINPGQDWSVSFAIRNTNNGNAPISGTCVLNTQAANSPIVVQSQPISWTISQQSNLVCTLPFMADLQNNRCYCPLSQSSCASGQILDASTCSCKSVPNTCGNGVCDSTETRGTCPQDCGQPICSDGTHAGACAQEPNVGMRCNKDTFLLEKDASCLGQVCPTGQHRDTTSGTCVPDFKLEDWMILAGILGVGAIAVLMMGGKKRR
jgi:hypothetical protein